MPPPCSPWRGRMRSCCAAVASSPATTAAADAFEVAEGETVDLRLSWFPAHLPVPDPLDVDACIARPPPGGGRGCTRASRPAPTTRLFAGRCSCCGCSHTRTRAASSPPRPRASPSTSAAPQLGLPLRVAPRCRAHARGPPAPRLQHEAQAWRHWLLRAIAGDPIDLQIMYGLAGERRLAEWAVDTLPGYDGAAPCASATRHPQQYQADIFGEVMVALDVAPPRRHRR